jgi:hypothetical protein
MGGSFADALNQQLDPTQRRFRLRTAFDLTPKGTNIIKYEDFTTVLNTNGSLGLIEFTGALPRAKLYPQWQIVADGQATLKKLADPAFDPTQTVLVENQIATPAGAGTNGTPGTVEFVSYAPKRLQLKASASSPSVLLLNDKYDPNWKVRVDGNDQALLRCNFLMRGVYLEPGQHTVEFRYQPPMTGFFVSLGAVIVALGLCGVAAFSSKGPKTAPDLITVPEEKPKSRVPAERTA